MMFQDTNQSFPKFATLFDFHTHGACQDLGSKFDPEQAAEDLKQRGIEFVVLHARCNQGYAYYDTKVGIKHPALKTDLFGEFTRALRKRNILVSAYINAGLSQHEGYLHRDWLTISPEGEIYRKPYNFPEFRTMCYNSPYADHLLAMVDELSSYPVTGFFFDCLMPHPCIGAECIEEMKTLKMTPEQFADYSRLRIVRRLAEKVRGYNRNYMLFFNCVPFALQVPFASYLEFECLPTGGWGYDALQVNARYLRTLGLPVVHLTGRFHESWGDFGGIRTETSVESDCFTGFANGMNAFSIGDHLHPNCQLNKPVLALEAKLNSLISSLAPFLKDARPLVDIALVIPSDAHDNTIASVPSVRTGEGFCRMMCELKLQFDILQAEQDFSKYKLIILADNVRLDDDLQRRVKDFLAGGGKLIATGHSGLPPVEQEQQFPEFWCARYEGETPHHPGYFKMAERITSDVPDMPVTLFNQGIAMKADNGSESLAKIIAPYYNEQFDGQDWYMYLPPAQEDGCDFIVFNGQMAHCSHELGFTYYKHAQVPIRSALKVVIDRMLDAPTLEISGLPSFGRATVQEQPGRRTVWLTAYVPERRGEKNDIMEDRIITGQLSMKLRLPDGTTPKTVYLMPRNQKLDWTFQDGICTISVPSISGYGLVVCEYAQQ